MPSLTDMTNPFRTSIMSDPWQSAEVDVPAIHAAVFDECGLALEQVRTSQRSTSLLIHGSAGSGKTHLLARLRERALKDSTAIPEQACVFVWVRLQTSPRMIWRYVRSRFVDDLLRRTNGGRSQLEHAIILRLAALRPADGDLNDWWEWFREDASEELEELFDELAAQSQLPRRIATVVKQIILQRHCHDAHSWLRGESLTESILSRLGLTVTEEADDDPEHQARETVHALCRLLGSQTPVIFSFDQVEALQVHPDELAGLFAFGQMVSSLHDDTNNVLIISCIQSAFFELLREKSRGADYDRMREYGARSLLPLTVPLASQLLTARLNSSPEIAQLEERTDDGLWPFTTVDVERLVGPYGCSPRKLLAASAERFAELQHVGPPAAPPAFETVLQELWDQRSSLAAETNTPERSEEILLHGLPLLIDLTCPDWQAVDDEILSDVQLVFSGPGGRVGISLCTDSNMRKLGSQFKRLLQQHDEERLAHLFLIRDSRSPMSKSAKKAQEHLDELTSFADVDLVHPDVPALVDLDAWRSLLSDAKAGDLSYRGETLAVEAVAGWLTAHVPDSLSNTLQMLLLRRNAALAISTRGVSTDELFQTLTARLADQHEWPLTELAAELDRPEEAIENAVRQHPEVFGLVAGPPKIIFERASA